MVQQFSPGKRFTLQVPASAANLGPGFDSIGLGLSIWDEVDFTVAGDELVITVDGEGAESVPSDARHLVWRACLAMFNKLGVTAPVGAILNCRNAIAHSRGLGSSAAAAVIGAAGALALLGNDISTARSLALINDVASDIESHPDNASASVYGGLTISWRSDDESGWCSVAPALHPAVKATVFVPSGTLSTHTARAALAPSVSLRDAANTAGRSAVLVEALTRSPDLLMAGTRDWLHQEPRRSSYPASMSLVDDLRHAGYAAVISGAGPSVLVLDGSHANGVEFPVDPQWTRLQPQIARQGVRLISQTTSG